MFNILRRTIYKLSNIETMNYTWLQLAIIRRSVFMQKLIEMRILPFSVFTLLFIESIFLYLDCCGPKIMLKVSSCWEMCVCDHVYCLACYVSGSSMSE